MHQAYDQLSFIIQYIHMNAWRLHNMDSLMTQKKEHIINYYQWQLP